MFSFRNPRPNISDSSEDEDTKTVPQTPSDYDPENLTSTSQYPFDPETLLPPNFQTFIPEMAPTSDSPFTQSRTDHTTSASPAIKKKLKTPTPYSGKRELRKFLQEVKIYLLANGDAYPDDMDKVLFVLSYMSEGRVFRHS